MPAMQPSKGVVDSPTCLIPIMMFQMIQFVDAESLTEPEVGNKCRLIETIGSAACKVTTLDGWSTAKHKDFL